MKAIKMFFILALSGILFLTSCDKDDNGPQGPAINFENCDESGCDAKDCATMVPFLARINCTIEDGSDVDWYEVEVTQADVDNNFGVYSFDFANDSYDHTLIVELFAEGVSSEAITVTGNGDLEYEPRENLVGGIQVFSPGVYYFSVKKTSGSSGTANYRIRID